MTSGSKKDPRKKPPRSNPVREACTTAGMNLDFVVEDLKRLGIHNPFDVVDALGQPEPRALVITIVQLAKRTREAEDRLASLERSVKAIETERDRAKLKHEGGLEALEALGRGNMRLMPFDHFYGPGRR